MIAITGATGNLGRLIVTELMDHVKPDEVAVVVRSPQKAIPLAPPGIAIRQGDYDDYASLLAAFDGVETLMFISNSDVPKRMVQHQNVVNAARAAGVKHVVYTSYIDIDGAGFLAQTHKASEEIIKGAGFAYTFLRNNLYMDIYVKEVQVAMESGVYRSANKEAGVTYVTRGDIARTAAAVLSSSGHENRAYALAGPAVVRPADFAEIATEISGRPVAFEQISWEELPEYYVGRGMPPPMIEVGVMLEKLISTNVLAVESEDIANLTGKPPVDFRSYALQELC
jgi:NAD(P)H dehydrogenase (quinone)